jgi:hypothetical protein
MERYRRHRRLWTALAAGASVIVLGLVALTGFAVLRSTQVAAQPTPATASLLMGTYGYTIQMQHPTIAADYGVGRQPAVSYVPCGGGPFCEGATIYMLGDRIVAMSSRAFRTRPPVIHYVVVIDVPAHWQVLGTLRVEERNALLQRLMPRTMVALYRQNYTGSANVQPFGWVQARLVRVTA